MAKASKPQPKTEELPEADLTPGNPNEAADVVSTEEKSEDVVVTVDETKKAAKVVKSEPDLEEAESAPAKQVRVRCLVTDTCNVAGVVYQLTEKQTMTVPEDVCAILSNAGWALKL